MSLLWNVGYVQKKWLEKTIKGNLNLEKLLLRGIIDLKRKKTLWSKQKMITKKKKFKAITINSKKDKKKIGQNRTSKKIRYMVA